MEEELSKQKARLSLIDVSAEDDSLFISPPPCDSRNPKTSALSEKFSEVNCFGVVEAESALGGENPMEQLPVALEQTEPTRTRRVGKCNLRKSLAWDSAFFTSEGVLDPDELELVNKPAKAGAQALPGIEEDVRMSADSNSTLGSDSWALESLEVDLFEDIRASIQKSGRGYDKISNVASSICKATQREPEAQYLSPSQKVDLASRNQMKPVSKLPISAKRQSISKMEADTKGEAFARSRTVVTRKVDRNLSLRPPKILSGANPVSTVPTKKIVAASDGVKLKNNTSKVCGNAVNQRPNQRPAVSKKLSSGDSLSITSGTLPSPKSSLGSTCTTKMRPTISGNGSDSTSSGSTGKSATKNLRNKTFLRNADPSSMDSTAKTPLRNPRNKIDFRNSNLSAYVMSTSKFSSSISPASSFDGMSSESSSSICSASQRPYSVKASLDVISLDSLESEAPQSPDSQNPAQDQQPHVGDKDLEKGLPNQGVKKANIEPLSNPAAAAATKSSFVGNAGSRFKPSGLRMPSPKIGFFDAEKSAGITSNGCLQSHSGMQIGLLKNTSVNGNLDGSLKQKSYKFQSTRSLTQTGLMKFNSNNSGLPRYAAASSLQPTSTPHLQLSSPTAKQSGTLATTEGDPNVFVKERLGQSSLGQHESTEKKILVSEDPVNGLSRHLDDVNLNMDSAKDLKGVKGFSHSPVEQSKDTSSDLLSSSLSGELFQDRKVDFLQSTTNPSVSAFPNKAELKPNGRSPLQVNHSFGNSSISLEPMREPTTEKSSDKTAISSFLDKTINTVTPDALLDHAVKHGQENVISNSLYKNWVVGNEKENNSE
eukprot:TRINITY_DN26624_c0_g1_i1.p1 TRINITY_DN26624_c0_g1~~TRINITY_DN26624_c0_g1_i1.p1  ORF type:complete len:824 (-),score=205.54 TRINITY_DN26624_c0_g1_i1:411-2882(-)